ncbi:MAG TPA: S-layer homology domain-containing protein, partial [Chloroflexia bacterium]
MSNIPRAGILSGALLLATVLFAPARAAQPATPAVSPLLTDPMSISVDARVSAAEVQALHQAGVQLVRYPLAWWDVQPQDTGPGQYNWSIPDAGLQALAAANVDVLLVLGGNPRWAASKTDGPVNRVPVARYYDFVTQAATRYGRSPYTVRAWEIYNEEDSTQTGWGTNAAGYAALLHQDYLIIKAIAPQTDVVMGGLAYDWFQDQCQPNGTCGPFVRNFLPNFLAAGGGAWTDAVNFHHYPRTFWPSLGAVVQALQTTLQAAHVQKPLLWTETSSPSSPEYQGSLEAQSAYVVQAYASGLGQGLNAITWFPLQDFTSTTFRYFTTDGLMNLDNSYKPSFLAYQVAAGYLGRALFLRPLTAQELVGTTVGEGYLFLETDGNGVTVAWTRQGTGSESLLAAHVRAVKNKYGRAVAYTVSNGQAIIPLSTDPVYAELQLVSPSATATNGPPATATAQGTATPTPLTPQPPSDTATATPSPPATASATPSPCLSGFSDVQPSDYFYTPVRYLVCRGAISGYADGTFRPANPTSRAQMVKIVVLGFSKPVTTPPAGGYTFADVPPSHPFFAFIETAAATGIVSGYTCGGPGEPC